jgi:glycosyltransferase involved in cell wall biosynthesis
MVRPSRLTVIMPVRNGEKYLRPAIDSLLGQTFPDFELLILDDGSTDGSAGIVESYTDSRIRLVRKEGGPGLAATLNLGLDLSRGEYIARMDCDDISLPNRLAAQVDFLERHPGIGICGCWVKCIGEGKRKVWRYPSDPETARCLLLFRTPLAHPTVVMRRDLLERSGLRYDPALRRAQDFDLWARASRCFGISNVPRVLFLYRLHCQQVGALYAEEQRFFSNHVWRAQLEKLDIQPTADELLLHGGQFSRSRENVERYLEWLSRIQDANRKTGLYPEPVLSRVLAEQWFSVCKGSARLGGWTWEMFRKAPFSRMVPVWQRSRLALKCALRLSR